MDRTPANGFRTFLILLVTQGVSVFGSMLSYFAVNVWLTQTLYAGADQREELAFALTAISLAFMVPQLLLGAVAGALADRWDRRKMMLTADLGLAATTFVMLGLMATQRLSLPVLLLLEVLSAICSTFHQSAFETSHAMLLQREQFTRANGMMQTVFSLARVFGPTTAAMLMAVPAFLPAGLPHGLSDGAVLAIGLDAVSFLFSALVLCFLPIPSPKREQREQQKGSLWGDVREGIGFLLERRPLLWLLTLFVVANMGMPLVALFPPLLLKFNLASDLGAHGYSFEAALAIFGSAGSAGAVLGGIVVSSWGGLKRNRVWGVLLPMGIFGVALVMLGGSSMLWLSVAAAFIVNAHVPFVAAHSSAIWQSQVPKELQGRVFSVRRVIAISAMPLATLVGGSLSGLFDPGVILAIVGGLMLLLVVAQSFNRQLRRLDGPAPVLQPAMGD